MARRRRAYCSPEHQKRARVRAKKARRRGLRKAERVSLWAIYRRDRGRCQLCRKAVGRRFLPPDRRAATLDHIVPVSQGGAHEARNLQLAHYGCNSAKGTRPCGSQLRLLA